MWDSSTLRTSRGVLAALAFLLVASLAVLTTSVAPAFAAAPTIDKNVSQSNPNRNDDGTFPSGKAIIFELSVGCSFNGQDPQTCDSFELHDTTPTFTDVDGNVIPMVFKSAVSNPVGGVAVDATDPNDIVMTFPSGLAAGESLNIDITFEFPAGITPDLTTAVNQAYVVDPADPANRADSPAVEVTARAKAAFETTKTGPSTVNPNEDVTYTLSVCGTDPSDPYFGSLRGTIEDATFTDTLPAGFTFVSASNGGTHDPATGEVFWDLGDITLRENQCHSETVTIRYESDEPLLEPINTINTLEVGGTPPPGSEFDPNAEAPITVTNPSPGVPSVDKDRGRYELDVDLNDGQSDSHTNYYLEPANLGQGPIMNFLVSDAIPEFFVMETFATGTWAAGATGPAADGIVEFLLTRKDGTVENLADAPYSCVCDGTTDEVFTIANALANPVVNVAVDYGNVPAGWRQDADGGRIDFRGFVIDPGWNGTPATFNANGYFTFPNTVVFSGTVIDAFGDEIDVSGEDTEWVRIETPRPRPHIRKSVSAVGNVAPGNGVYPSSNGTDTVITWRIRVANAWSATDDFVNPIISDIVPVLPVGPAGTGLGPAHNFQVVLNPAGLVLDDADGDGLTSYIAGGGPNGEELLIWEFQGAMEKTDYIVVEFDTVLLENTPPQDVINDSFVTSNDYTDAALEVIADWTGGYGDWIVDVDDVDNDGNSGEMVRISPIGIAIVDYVLLASVKDVRGPAGVDDCGILPAGDLNEVYGPDRCTQPGETVEYRLSVENDGNVPVENLVLVDLFPFPGDMTVQPNQTTGAVFPRGSDFLTNLVGPVTSTDPNVIIEYTTEIAPCRGENFYPNLNPIPDPAGCTAPNWTTTLPAPVSSVTGIRISYDAILAVAESFDFEWPMRASVGAVPGEIATNSFAWGAKSAVSDVTNAAEPPPVNIAVSELGDYLLGNLVWYDRDYNGGQDGGPEVGVLGVPMAVYLDNNGNGTFEPGLDTFVDDSVTDPNPATVGQYLFTELPEGNYVVVFAPPNSWVVSPQFTVGLEDDSNGAYLGTFGTGSLTAANLGWDPTVAGASYDELFVTDFRVLPSLDADELPNDLSVDLGIWRPDPSITLEKHTNTVDADTPTGPYIPEGDTVTWEYFVTNTGNTVLENIVVTDNLEGPATCPQDTLAIGESMTCELTGVAGSGQYANESDVTGDPVLPDIPWPGNTYDELVRLDGTPFFAPDGSVIPVIADDPSHYFGAVADIELEKATNGVDADVPTGPFIPAGDAVTWTYEVTIPAGATVGLNDLQLLDDNGTPADPSDDLSSWDDGNGIEIAYVSGDADADGILDLTETWIFEATGVATFGQYGNNADISGQPVTPDGTPIVGPDGELMDRPDADDPSHYYGTIQPAIDIEKSTNGIPADEPGTAPAGPLVVAGSVVEWTYVIENTGNVDLEVTGFTDDQIGAISTCLEDAAAATATFPVILAPGDVVTCTVEGVAVVGDYRNEADVLGTPVDENGDPITEQDGPNGPEPVVPPVDDDPSHYTGEATPMIDIEKSTNTVDADLPEDAPEIPVGATATWEYVITNTGNVALEIDGFTDDQIANVDTLCTPAIAWPIVLQPLESVSCEFSELADVIGLYANVADVAGTPVDVNGDPIVDVNGDPLPDVDDLDPSHYYALGGAIDLEKSTNGYDADVVTGPYIPLGDDVTWEYVVTNTGNVALTDVVIIDDTLVGQTINGAVHDGLICTIPLLLVGESASCSLTAEATFAGQYRNDARTDGQPSVPVDPAGDLTDPANYGPLINPDTDEPVSRVDDEDPSHYFGLGPAIDLEKATNGHDADSPTGPSIELGGTVAWTYVATNTGNVALTNVVINDDIIGFVCTIPLLLVGESATCEMSGIAETLGQYANIGDVTGVPSEPIDPNGDPNDPDNYTPIVDPETGEPIDEVVADDPSHYYGVDASVDIEKFTNGVQSDAAPGELITVGDDIVWTYVVTNTGNAPLIDLVVTDDVLGHVCDIALLLPGESTECELEGVADTDGVYANIGDVVGTPAEPVDPDGDPNDPDNYTPITDPETGDPVPPVDDDDPSHYFGADPSIDIEKFTNGVQSDEGPGEMLVVGDTVIWTYVVTNTGNVPIADIQVFDDVEGLIDCPLDTLYPIGSDEGPSEMTCEHEGTVVAGEYANTGSVAGQPVDPETGEPCDCPVVEDDDPSHYEAEVKTEVQSEGEEKTLPRTGINTDTMAFMGLGLLLLGAFLAMIGRRRREDEHVS